MDRARWHRIQRLFHDAADVPQGEQRVFLEAACGDDEELVVEVLAMLDQDASGHSLLDRNIADIAQETLANCHSGFPDSQRIRSVPNHEVAGRRRNGSRLSCRT